MFRAFKNIFLFLILSFIYLPIIILIIYSFNSGDSGFIWQGFSLKWYKEIFVSSQIKSAIFNTILIAIISSLTSVVIGIIGAYAIYKSENKKLKTILLSVNKITIINPDIVTGISLMTFYSAIKMQLGFSTMLISHIIFFNTIRSNNNFTQIIFSSQKYYWCCQRSWSLRNSNILQYNLSGNRRKHSNWGSYCFYIINRWFFDIIFHHWTGI